MRLTGLLMWLAIRQNMARPRYLGCMQKGMVTPFLGVPWTIPSSIMGDLVSLRTQEELRLTLGQFSAKIKTVSATISASRNHADNSIVVIWQSTQPTASVMVCEWMPFFSLTPSRFVSLPRSTTARYQQLSQVQSSRNWDVLLLSLLHHSGWFRETE